MVMEGQLSSFNWGVSREMRWICPLFADHRGNSVLPLWYLLWSKNGHIIHILRPRFSGKILRHTRPWTTFGWGPIETSKTDDAKGVGVFLEVSSHHTGLTPWPVWTHYHYRHRVLVCTPLLSFLPVSALQRRFLWFYLNIHQTPGYHIGIWRRM